MERKIYLEWYHPHSREDVWECLTDPEMIGQWLMENDFKPETGHKFQFRSKPVPGWSGIVDCEVLEVDKPNRLSYTWTSGPRPGMVHIQTVVTWTLQQKDNGTLLTLEHTGFKGFRGFFLRNMLRNGWKGKIAKAFAALLNR